MDKLKKCVIPGSFDPFTIGHMDIIKTAWNLFDEVHVLVAENPDKTYMFTADERVEIIKNALKETNNFHTNYVHVVKWDRMIYDYTHTHFIDYIMKGVRNYDDLVWENKQADFNREHGCATLYMPSISKNVSSTIIRESIKNGNEVWKEYVHPSTIEYINKKFQK